MVTVFGEDTNTVREITKQDRTLTVMTYQSYLGIYNDHRLVTTYQYNSLNQVVQQYSPDGDTTQFFYDRLGRLTVSQNKEQQSTASYSGSANRFSYTTYDALGRISEVGEKSGATDVRSTNMLDTTAVKTWLSSGTNRQVTRTIYDSPVNPLQSVSASRKRVTASIYLENGSDNEGDSTLYVYDISGNVKTLIQHVKALVAADPTNGKKRIDYDYDLVSGKVNTVRYQDGKGDQFYYKYLYDADNRVIQSLSSRDKLVWTDDASYLYYLHGPLARTELGHWKVQGVDYAYTLQGWLKGINGDALSPNTEMANDGSSSSIYSRVSRDVYAFKLGYFNNDSLRANSNDYKPIGGSRAPAFEQYAYTKMPPFDVTGNQLFNGNISYSTLALSKFDSSSIRGYSYGYDQLNRLVEMRQHNVSGSWDNSNIISAYAESITYDANGNITKYLRRGANTPGNRLDMDSLSYKYNWGTDGKLINNQLNYVKDTVSSSNYSVDIDNQSPNNYTYDHIGNLKKDVAEGIDTIRWTVYGKINRIVKNSNSLRINYGYDAGGNRTTKLVSGAADTTTFYVRDAQGNVLAVYSKKGSDALQWNEQDLYGSSRIGLWRWDTIVPASPPVVGGGSSLEDSLMIGARNYELTNHLGNVLSTISDKKIGHDSSGTVNYYIAEVLSQNDYYPFGMLMPGRKYSATGSYMYGFNGQQKSLEINQNGDNYTADYWQYDSRTGTRWNIDPKPNFRISPYACFDGNPLFYTDVLGDTIKGANQTSAARVREQVRNSFTGDKAENLRALFKLSSDNLTMAPISEHDFVNAVAGLSNDLKQLAYSYFEAINGRGVQTVEMAFRSEALSSTAMSLFHKNSVADLDQATGGGVNVATSHNSSYSVIVMNSQSPIRDNVTSSGIHTTRLSSPGELIAHEVLGHGFGWAVGSPTYRHEDALQMTNLYRRATGISTYRDGASHGSQVVLSSTTANQVPNFAQLPSTLLSQISAIEREQVEAAIKASRFLNNFINQTQNINLHNDRLVNPIGTKRIIQPMGKW